MNISERERELQRRAELIGAELAGLRSGVLPMIEARRDFPDPARTPRALAESLGMSIPSVNNHCLRMFKAGLLDRTALSRADGGGRQFAYQPRAPGLVRRIRADGIPHGIRDACSECAEVAWESCFLRGQCRYYVNPREVDWPEAAP